MIDKRLPLNCRKHFPIFLALLMISIAIPAFSHDNVQLEEHRDNFALHRANSGIIIERLKRNSWGDGKQREARSVHCNPVNCDQQSCMRVANNFNGNIQVDIVGHGSFTVRGKNYCTVKNEGSGDFHNVKLRHPEWSGGAVIYEGPIDPDQSIIIGKDGRMYNAKYEYGNIWKAEDGSYP